MDYLNLGTGVFDEATDRDFGYVVGQVVGENFADASAADFLFGSEWYRVRNPYRAGIRVLEDVGIVILVVVTCITGFEAKYVDA
jgi:hypothetical protein